MATTRYQSNDLRRQVGSPRPKGRENKETLCRNVLIYGHCRYEDQGCTFSHDQNKGKGNQPDQRKSLNVESPSFTPANLQSTAKKATFTTHTASAPAFTPKGASTSNASSHDNETTPAFNPAAIREFTPSFDLGPAVSGNGTSQDGAVPFDPFNMSGVGQALPTPQYNPYADEHHAMAGGAGYFPGQGGFAPLHQPLQYHLYAPVGPRPEDLMAYHRVTSDFFMAEKLREKFQRKSEAALQVMPNAQLPQLDNYHSLVALDTSYRKNANIFGYPSWIYKATSSKTGHIYCLRRLEGFRLTNEHAIRSVKEWRRVCSGSVVTTHDAFTTRAFGDSSLIFVQDCHPLSKTLVEAHLSTTAPQAGRYQQQKTIPEKTLWSYISQITNALKAIHSLNLAARCLDLSKIVLTDENRIRLNACSILDVVQFEARRPIEDLQQEDFIQFGRAMLCLSTNTLPASLTNLKHSIDQMSRTYSIELRDTILWLLTPQQPPAQKTIDEFIRGISTHYFACYETALQENDELTTEFGRELENGRIARLMMKLATVNERQEFNGDQNWSENGERYMLKLFRDYVFHQVDANGNPLLDIGHMTRCLNKLDAGIDERICLTSRDDQTSFLVSYRELNKQLNAAFTELQKGGKQQGRSI